MNAQAVNLEFFALNKAIKQTNWLHVLSPALISFMISGGPCATSPFQFPIKSPVSVAELTRILYKCTYTTHVHTVFSSRELSLLPQMRIADIPIKVLSVHGQKCFSGRGALRVVG